MLPVVLAERHDIAQRKLDRVFATLDDREFWRSNTFGGTPDEAIAYYPALADAGLQYFLPFIWGNDFETLHLLGE